LDLVRIQDRGLRSSDDPSVLEWAAKEDRVIVTHDVRTMTAFAIQRIQNELPFPGLIEISRSLSVNSALQDLLLIAECGEDADFRNQIIYLPL
jgi:hypothetical protein